jgi:sarcosine oxidase gamma subunit
MGDMTADLHCEHPNHVNYLKAFLKKYHTANKDAHFSVNMVDPEEWYISDEEKNTTKCCQMCSISEDIAMKLEDMSV